MAQQERYHSGEKQDQCQQQLVIEVGHPKQDK